MHSSGIHAYLNTHRTLSSNISSSMPVHETFVDNNASYVASFGEKGALPLAPGKKLAIGMYLRIGGVSCTER